MNTKNNKRSQATIQKLKSALITQLKIKELNKIKINSLCEEANVNRTTFYAHYDNVEDVLYEMCEDEIYEVYKGFQNKNLTYKEKLKNGIIIINNNIDKFKFFFKYVHNIEERIISIVKSMSSNTLNDISNITTLMSLVFIVSGFVGVGKVYISTIEKNPKIKLNLNEFTDMIYNSINIENPNFKFE